MESEFFSTIHSISTTIRDSNILLIERINRLEDKINLICSIPPYISNKSSDVIIHGENKNYYAYQYYSTIK